MNKIDLIIDALEKATWTSYSYDDADICKQALAAARELKALDPVAWRHKHGNEWHYMGKDDPFPPDGWEPLYGIEEVTK
jgi:hypothetical protein